MSKTLEISLSIPVTMDDVYAPEELLQVSRILRKHCENLVQTTQVGLTKGMDSVEIAANLHDMAEKIMWYYLGQLQKGKFRGRTEKYEILGNSTDMQKMLSKIINQEKPKGYEYQTSQEARELEKRYHQLTNRVA